MRPLLLTLVLLALVGTVSTRGDNAEVRALAPFLDNDVVAVGRLDLARLDVETLARRLIADRELADEATASVAPWLTALRRAGANELYALIVLPELLSPSPAPFSVIVPLTEGADAKAIGALLCGTAAVKGPATWPTCATLHRSVFAGTPEALERLRQVKPVERPELAAALAALGEVPASVVLMPSADGRRVLEELLPTLPRELGGGPITAVTRGLKWLSAGLGSVPEPRLQLVVQAADAPSARSLDALGKELVTYLRRSGDVARAVPDFGRLSREARSEVRDDRVSVTIDAGQASAWAAALLKPLRENAARTQCVNSLKQIGLALHNYYSVHNAFPPAYAADQTGRPLLSWRVLILPYLEQEALFKEFHLDEPWDSPHNQALIDRMPAVYLCPNASDRKADRGKTTYVAPRGKATVWPGPEGVKIPKITDGTSNTIFVADAPAGRSVIWTKPEDWETEGNPDLKGIFGGHPGGTNFLFVDGSVRFIGAAADPKVLKKLLTKDGGEVIGQDEF